MYLCWDSHINFVCSKISRNIGIMNNLKLTIPRKVLLMMYNAFILPHIAYCNVLWGSLHPSKLLRLHRLQKRILRICANSHYLEPSLPLFVRFQMLNVFDINTMQIACLMRRFFSNSLPSYLMHMFSLNAEIHQYNTRQSVKFHMWKVNTNTLSKSVRCFGPVT